jgi:hypothetical protein
MILKIKCYFNIFSNKNYLENKQTSSNSNERESQTQSETWKYTQSKDAKEAHRQWSSIQ